MNIHPPPSSTPHRLRRRFPRWLILLLAFILVIIIYCSYSPVARWWTHSQGEHLAYAQANGHAKLNLPEQASDIRFEQHTHPSLTVSADFAISEEAFLSWAAKNGWQLKPITSSVTVWQSLAFGGDTTEVVIKDGLHFDNISRGKPNTVSVVYDRRSRRAYYHFRAEPFDD